MNLGYITSWAMSLSTMFSPRMCVSKKVEANSAGIMVQQEVGDPRGMSAATAVSWQSSNGQNSGDRRTRTWIKWGFKEFAFLPWRDSNWERADRHPHSWYLEEGWGGLMRPEEWGNPAQIPSPKWWQGKEGSSGWSKGEPGSLRDP